MYLSTFSVIIKIADLLENTNIQMAGLYSL